MNKELDRIMYKERLRDLGLLSLEKAKKGFYCYL